MSVADRRERVRARMAAVGVDLLAVAPGADLRYLLGVTPHPDERCCIVLLGPERIACCMPALNALEFHHGVGDLPVAVFPWNDADGPDEALDAALDAAGLAPGRLRLAMGAAMRVDHALALERALSRAGVLAWPPAALSTDVVAPVRMRKDPEELAALAGSAAVADTAMERAIACLAVGVRESDVSQAAAAAFAAQGAAMAFGLVAAGPASAEPHHPPGPRPVGEDEAVFLDIGGDHFGYQSDLTRMAFVGRPDARFREVYDTVRRACDAGLAAVRVGAQAADVDRAARKVIDDAGYGPHFVHRTGHGIGLEGHEPPSMQAGDATVLDVGMAFSIEPGIYLPGAFGVRIEDIIVVEADGGRRLSRLGHDVAIIDAREGR